MTSEHPTQLLSAGSGTGARYSDDLVTAGELARRLVDALVRINPATPVGAQRAAQLRGALAHVEGHQLTPAELIGESGRGRSADYLDRSPVSGRLNPLAPPLSLSVGDDGVARARLSLGMAYQGPPARVHGGVVATLLDHVMGYAAGTAGTWAFTRSLTVDYDLAVPLLTDLDLSAVVERVDGRKVWVRGDISVDGETLVRATGLWLPARTPEQPPVA